MAKINVPSAVIEIDEFRTLLHKHSEELAKSLTPLNRLEYLYSRPMGLLAASDAEVSAKKTRQPPEIYTSEIKRHAGYKRLVGSPQLQNALRIFRERRQFDPDHAQAAIDEIRLIESILTYWSFSIHTAKSGWVPRTITAKQRAQAIKRASLVIQDIDDRIVGNDFISAFELKGKLVEYCEKLKRPRRREYKGRSRERYFLTSIAYDLVAIRGLPRDAAVEIVGACSEVFGFNLGMRSFQRYVAIAEKRLEDLYADVRTLREPL